MLVCTVCSCYQQNDSCAYSIVPVVKMLVSESKREPFKLSFFFQMHLIVVFKGHCATDDSCVYVCMS